MVIVIAEQERCQLYNFNNTGNYGRDGDDIGKRIAKIATGLI